MEESRQNYLQKTLEIKNKTSEGTQLSYYFIKSNTVLPSVKAA